jgi:predicted 2-oxoglutarate/Fe(II)-dependent dioxygenase YbiX
MGDTLMTYSTLIVEDFIDDKDLDLLIDSFAEAPFYSAPNNPNLFSYQMSKDYIHLAITDMINTKLTSTLEEHYKVKISQYTSGSVTRYTEGQYIGMHADWAPEDVYVQTLDKKRVDISSVTYLNEDFTGGELIFCEVSKDLLINKLMTLVPRRGMVIFFDALKSHYTNPIVKGVKYSYTNFYSLQD